MAIMARQGSKSLNTVGKQTRWRYCAVGVAIGACLTANTAFTATLAVYVTADGRPLPNAIVTAAARNASPAPTNRTGSMAIMVQRPQQFDPFVLPVEAVTTVAFSNLGAVRHHVHAFSFSSSSATPFELKLCGGDRKQSVTSDKPVVVALGRNVHDNMLAYIKVIDRPYFVNPEPTMRARSPSAPPGSDTGAGWLPDEGQKKPANQDVNVSNDGKADRNLTVPPKRQVRQRPAGASDDGAY